MRKGRNRDSIKHNCKFNQELAITHLLLHTACTDVAIEVTASRNDGAHHTLLLEVLIALILAQLNNIVLSLSAGFI